MTGSSVSGPKYWENLYFTVDLKFIFHFLSSSLLPVPSTGTSNFSGMRSIAFHRQVYNNNTDVAHPSPAQPFGFHLRIIREL